MADDLVSTKEGAIHKLGKDWPSAFLARHPELKSKYIPPLDKERALAQDPEILARWFELFLETRSRYEIKDHNTYNMDEKGFQAGVCAKVRVMVNKYETKKKAYMTQPGDRDWVSLIETISLDGLALPPWIIFKGKLYQKSWYQQLEKSESRGYIATTENGWSNNEVGLAWLSECFDKETENESTLAGEYRLLCVDGHASYITTAAIEFALSKKIIILCLPAHTTHILQPLDVGVFGALAINYKNLILRKATLGARYSIDKVRFIEYYIIARNMTLNAKTICNVWEKAGLSLYNPDLILQAFTNMKYNHQLFSQQDQ